MSDEAIHFFRVFPSSGVPIYRQVMDQVLSLLLSGQLCPGDLLPSVRSMASVLEVNPMTVSKAYSQLESEGVVERIRGLGMRVCERGAGGSMCERLEELSPLLEQVAGKAHQLGLSREQVITALKPLLSQQGVAGTASNANSESSP